MLGDHVLTMDSTRFTVNNVDNRLDDLSVHVDWLLDQPQQAEYRAEVIHQIKEHFSETSAGSQQSEQET